MILPILPYKYANGLKKTFGVTYTKYWDRFTGFDVISFDGEVVHSKDGESPREAIVRQWGEDALTLVEDIMAWERRQLGIPDESEEEELPCLREWDDADQPAEAGWFCLNDHTGCLWNNGSNTCSHPGESLSPLEEGEA